MEVLKDYILEPGAIMDTARLGVPAARRFLGLDLPNPLLPREAFLQETEWDERKG